MFEVVTTLSRNVDKEAITTLPRHPGLDPGSHQLGQSQGIAGQAWYIGL